MMSTTIFVEAFKQAFDFDITLAEARGPMGMGKWDHIRTLGNTPAIAERWVARFGQPMSDTDVSVIYDAFMPLQIAEVKEHAALIPGTLDVVTLLKEQQIRIGSCSGYPRPVMEALAPLAAAQGFVPQSIVASDDLEPGSRPGPWMALQNVIELGVMDVARCVKVDDSAPGIEEGRNAGMWTVGLALSGNEAGFTLDGFLAASEDEKQHVRQRVEARLKAASAHYVIDTIADLPGALQAIGQRLADGEKP
ncbi:phosphonoacetaldehyde hydrolase [Halomonas piscis]|uniref:Phosphonoacetaldehyde hydrolase n=1 Tax=Halomonas piscis TaxID=3031727 RepID=A0ABY9Z0B2_9GAMM|nr:phosphonoacetaldehyde hydrolase [Halomonas piscis]WNK20273.1 phosphonoacetaldehyde hydrolase [Halomonas piscis]